MSKAGNGKFCLKLQISYFFNATIPDIKCKIVTTLFYLCIIQFPVSIDELKQRLVEVWHDLQQNIIDFAIVVGAQLTLGEKTFLPEYIYEKFTKCPTFTWYLPEKYFPEFWGARAPSAPVSYAYGLGCQRDSMKTATEGVRACTGTTFGALVMSLSDRYLDWKNLCVNKILLTLFIHKTICCLRLNCHFLSSVIPKGKTVALDRWDGKWNNLSITHSLANECAKNYCNWTLIFLFIVENVVTYFFLRHSVHYEFKDADCIIVSSFHFFRISTFLLVTISRLRDASLSTAVISMQFHHRSVSSRCIGCVQLVSAEL